MKTMFRTMLLSCLALFVSSCGKQSSAEIDAAMAHYDHLLVTMNADSLAQMYVPDGKMVSGTYVMAAGRDSIRAFLSSFKNVEMLSHSSHATETTFSGDVAVQKGSYEQKAKSNGRDVTVKGEYTATWVRSGQGQWLLREMNTRPS